MSEAATPFTSDAPQDTERVVARSRWSMRAWTILTWAARLTVAGVFVAAAAPKVLDPAGFAEVVRRYELLPATLVPALAIVLPWVEIVAALALLTIRRWRLAGGVILAGLLLVFTGAAFSAWWRGLEIACGCFSTSAHATSIGWWLFARNTGLFALLLLAMSPTSLSRRRG